MAHRRFRLATPLIACLFAACTHQTLPTPAPTPVAVPPAVARGPEPPARAWTESAGQPSRGEVLVAQRVIAAAMADCGPTIPPSASVPLQIVFNPTGEISWINWEISDVPWLRCVCDAARKGIRLPAYAAAEAVEVTFPIAGSSW